MGHNSIRNQAVHEEGGTIGTVCVCVLCCVCVCVSVNLSVRPSVRPSVCSGVSLDAGGEADDGEEEALHVELLEHALDGLAVDPEGHAGGAQVQAAAHHVVRVQQVLVDGGHGPGDPT